MMTRQAQDAQQALRAAGFAASEFRVRTHRGRRRKLGDVGITLLLSVQETLPRVEAMLNLGLDVTLFTRGTSVRVILPAPSAKAVGTLYRASMGDGCDRLSRLTVADLAAFEGGAL